MTSTYYYLAKRAAVKDDPSKKRSRVCCTAIIKKKLVQRQSSNIVTMDNRDRSWDMWGLIQSQVSDVKGHNYCTVPSWHTLD